MKAIWTLAAVSLGAPAIAQPQGDPRTSTGMENLKPASQASHDPWAVSAASPYRNWADAIGSTSHQAQNAETCTPRDGASCREPEHSAEQPKQ